MNTGNVREFGHSVVVGAGSRIGIDFFGVSIREIDRLGVYNNEC